MRSDPVAEADLPRSRTLGEEPRQASKGQARLIALRLMGDAFCVLTALGSAYVLRFEFGFLELTESQDPVLDHHLFASGVWLASLLVFLIANRLYDEDTLFPGGGESARIARSILEAIAMLAIFVFLSQSFAVSRAWFLITVVLSGVYLLTWRTFFRHLVRRRRASGRWRRPAVVLYDSDADDDPAYLEEDGEFEVVGRLPATTFLERAGTQEHRFPVKPGSVLLIRAQSLSEEQLWKIVIAGGETGCPTFIHGATRSASRDRMSVREVGGRTIIKVSPPSLSGPKAVGKRAFDLAVSLALLIVLSPFLAVIAVSILLTTGRPVLFRQTRVGLQGREFHMLKFRSMRPGSENGDAGWTTPADPRRTPIGAVLRRFSLDELPQLWNVLVGHMSLVGPRPEVPSLVERFSREFPWYRYRHRIRPGMTGWAQSRGFRGDTSLSARLELDNRYIEHWSLALDIRILLATVREVLIGRNAY